MMRSALLVISLAIVSVEHGAFGFQVQQGQQPHKYPVTSGRLTEIAAVSSVAEPAVNANAATSKLKGSTKSTKKVNKNQNKRKGKTTDAFRPKTRKERNKQFLMKKWKSQQTQQKKKQERAEQKEKKKESELISAIGIDLANLQKKAGRSKDAPRIKGSKKKANQITKKYKKSKTDTESLLSWSSLQAGSTVSGTVKKRLPYGVLVSIPYDIPGGCVLLHRSQMEPGAELPKIGDAIENARILALSRDKGTATVTLMPLEQKRAPAIKDLQVGDEILGKVVRLQPYGAFLDLGLKRNALLHVSRMSMYKVNNVADHLRVGQWVPVRVLRMEKGDIAVSMLSRDNDAFVDRRDLQRKRMIVWDTLVNASNEKETAKAKKELLEIDRQIWNRFMNSMDGPKTGEV